MSHTAAFLASLGTFVLRAPIETLSVVFGDDVPMADDLNSWLPKKSLLGPRGTTTRLCQQILALVKRRKIVDGNTEYASPSTVAYALCLLARFRHLGHQLNATTEELIAISVYLAFQFLVDWGDGQRNYWAVILGMSRRRMGVLERDFLKALEYGAWIRNGEFHRLVSRMDLLWEEVLEEQMMESRPAPPDFVLKMFGKR